MEKELAKLMSKTVLVENIFKEIRHACLEGKFYVKVSFNGVPEEVLDNIEKELKKLGYLASFSMEEGFISWK